METEIQNSKFIYFLNLYIKSYIYITKNNIHEIQKHKLKTSVQYEIASWFVLVKSSTPSSENVSNETPSINEVFDKFKEIELLISKMKKDDDDAKNNLVP